MAAQDMGSMGSVEVLSLQSGAWKPAMALDVALDAPVLVVKEDNFGLLLIGGQEYVLASATYSSNSRVREFKCWNQECLWEEIPKELTNLDS